MCIGEIVNGKYTVTKLILENHFVGMSTVCMVGSKKVVDGEATNIVPSHLQ